ALGRIGGLQAPAHAVAEVALEDQAVDAVEGRLDRPGLADHVDAVAVPLDHLDHAPAVPPDAAQPRQDLGARLPLRPLGHRPSYPPPWGRGWFEDRAARSGMSSVC